VASIDRFLRRHVPQSLNGTGSAEGAMVKFRFGEAATSIAVLFGGVSLVDMVRYRNWPNLADPWAWVKGVVFALMLLWAMRNDWTKQATKRRHFLEHSPLDDGERSPQRGSAKGDA
jgi:hypothetical protein